MEIAQRLRGAIEKLQAAAKQASTEERDSAEEQKSVRERLADAANVTEKTIYNILSGRTWCDVTTIYLLEKELDTQLWPTGHVTERDTQLVTQRDAELQAAQFWLKKKNT